MRRGLRQGRSQALQGAHIKSWAFALKQWGGMDGIKQRCDMVQLALRKRALAALWRMTFPSLLPSSEKGTGGGEGGVWIFLYASPYKLPSIGMRGSKQMLVLSIQV